MAFVRKTREIRILLPEEFLQELSSKMPGIVWAETPYIRMQCTPLDEISESTAISGAQFTIDIAGEHQGRTIEIDEVKLRQEM